MQSTIAERVKMAQQKQLIKEFYEEKQPFFRGLLELIDPDDFDKNKEIELLLNTLRFLAGCKKIGFPYDFTVRINEFRKDVRHGSFF